MSNLVFFTCPSLQILGKTSKVFFSDFRIFGESLIKRNYHNSRTSDNTDMKLGSVTKLYKRKETKSKKFDDEFMSETVTSLSFFQFAAIRKPNSGRISCKTFYLSKTENRTKKSLTQLSYYCFE